MSNAIQKVEQAEHEAELRIAQANAQAAKMVDEARQSASDRKNAALIRAQGEAEEILQTAKNENLQKLQENEEYVTATLAQLEDAVVRRTSAAVESVLASIQ